MNWLKACNNLSSAIAMILGEFKPPFSFHHFTIQRQDFELLERQYKIGLYSLG